MLKVLPAVFTLAVWTSSGAMAAPPSGGDIERFAPSTSVDGLLGLEGPEAHVPGQISAGVWLRRADKPLVWRYADGTYDPVLDSRWTADLTARFGLVRSLDVGVHAPVVLYQAGPPSRELGDLKASGMGDLHIIPRFTVLPARIFRAALGVSADVTLPTGDQALLLGDAGASITPRVTGSVPVGPARLLASLGYRVRRNAGVVDLRLEDEVLIHAGAEVALDVGGVPVQAMAETKLSTAWSRPFSSGDVTAGEAIAGMRARLSGPWVAQGGVGLGLATGLGTPVYRVLLGIAYAPEPPDSDGDGLPDSADDCPLEPEDYDLYADLDGCPDEESATDDTPPQGADETPPPAPADRDGDGRPDHLDLCPDDPEDRDGFEDDDGCPELDNDSDGINDTRDLCPDRPETINGVDDYDGCPDVGEAATKVDTQRIEIRETINFETSKAVIKPESKLLLDQVALQILAHPDVQLLRIEGHTDSVGDARANLELSQARAEAVRDYLVTRGVGAHRLQPVGFGETRPVASNDTPRGRASNRRVEFVILEPAP